MKMPSLSIKERKAKFNNDDLILRKESNLPSVTLLSLWSYADIECNSAELLTNKYKLFETISKLTINSLAPSKKYLMIEEFKDELRGLKAHSKVWDNFWHLKALWKRWKMLFISL